MVSAFHRVLKYIQLRSHVSLRRVTAIRFIGPFREGEYEYRFTEYENESGGDALRSRSGGLTPNTAKSRRLVDS